MQQVSIAIAALLLSVVSGTTAVAVVLFGLVGRKARGPGRFGVDTVARMTLVGMVLLLAPLGFYMTHIKPYQAGGRVTVAAARDDRPMVRFAIRIMF